MKKILICTLAAYSIIYSSMILASGGDDHSHAEEEEKISITTINNDIMPPKKQADGSVFIPKPSQRQMGLRTLMLEAQTLAKSVELNATIIANPIATSKVQSTIAGRISFKSLPNIGQMVKKGQVLATVTPATNNIEVSNQQAQIAQLQSTKNIAMQTLARYKGIEDTIPKKEFDILHNQIASSNASMAALSIGLNKIETLVAPSSGRVNAINVVAGQVVNPSETLFEIVDPNAVLIEAISFDTSLAGNIASAFIVNADTNVDSPQALKFIGAANTLKQQTLALRFSLNAANNKGYNNYAYAVGQNIKVSIQNKQASEGFSLPRKAIVKNASNQDIVWLKVADKAEYFRPINIMYEALDSGNIKVNLNIGLNEQDRVVVDGVDLINQIR
jgi:membrane fusion protein, heavy metal efflux system